MSYQGSDLDEINEDGEVVRAIEMKNEFEDILQRRSSAISSDQLSIKNSSGQKEAGAIINFNQVEKIGERLPSEKIAPVFKIKDTTPFEKKWKQKQQSKKREKHTPPKKEKKKRRYGEDSSSDSLDEIFKKDVEKH